MFVGTPSNPINFLAGQSDPVNDRELTVTIFTGEVLAAFHANTKLRGLVENRSLEKGATVAEFYKTWKARAFYHSRGVEMVGENIETGKIAITVDHPLVSPFSLYDLDVMLSKVDFRTQFAAETGLALAQTDERNIARSLIIAARTPNDGVFPGGLQITDAALTSTGAIDGLAWLDAIREARLRQVEELFVPEGLPFYMLVKPRVFDAMRHARNANGHYVFEDSQRNQRPESLQWEDVTIMSSVYLPSTDESADEEVYAKYRANFSTTTGVLWTPKAVGAALMMDIGFEMMRDTKRLEDFQVAKMLTGYGTVRAEGALEFKTA